MRNGGFDKFQANNNLLFCKLCRFSFVEAYSWLVRRFANTRIRLACWARLILSNSLKFTEVTKVTLVHLVKLERIPTPPQTVILLVQQSAS